MYFDKIFPAYTEGMDVSDRKYPYSTRNSLARITGNTKFESLKESVSDLAFNRACKMESLGNGQAGTSLLQGFIPDIFTATIQQFGKRICQAKRDLPLVLQSENSTFKNRLMWQNDSSGIYREGDTIQGSISKRATEEFAFNKLVSQYLYSWELLEDSGTQLNQIAIDTAFAANKQSQLTDMLWMHQLTYDSDSITNPQYNPYNYFDLGCDSANVVPTFSMISKAIGDGMLKLTNRLEDSVDMASLRLYLSPTVYRILWDDDSFRRWDILGSVPLQITGKLPQIYGMTPNVIQTGYFDSGNNWVDQPYDIFLVSMDNCGAIRQRADVRIQPIVEPLKQMEGFQVFQRLRIHTVNKINFCRISCNDSNPVQKTEKILYKPKDLTKTLTAEEMVSIGE